MIPAAAPAGAPDWADEWEERWTIVTVGGAVVSVPQLFVAVARVIDDGEVHLDYPGLAEVLLDKYGAPMHEQDYEQFLANASLCGWLTNDADGDVVLTDLGVVKLAQHTKGACVRDQLNSVLFKSGSAGSATPPDAGKFHGKAEAGVVYVRRYFGPAKPTPEDPGETEQEGPEYIAVRRFPAETVPGRVSASFSGKVNLGDFSSAGIDVFVSVPAYLEEVDQAYEWVKDFAGRKANEGIKKIKAMKEKKDGQGQS